MGNHAVAAIKRIFQLHLPVPPDPIFLHLLQPGTGGFQHGFPCRIIPVAEERTAAIPKCIHHPNLFPGTNLQTRKFAINENQKERIPVLCNLQMVPLPRLVRKINSPNPVQAGQRVLETLQLLEKGPNLIRTLHYTFSKTA